MGASRPEENCIKMPKRRKKHKGAGLKHPLLWVDLEMTGLDVSRDTILEVAAVLTSGCLEKSVEGPCIVIQHPAATLEAMNEWCVAAHGRSGLTEAVTQSSTSMTEAEDQLLEFLDTHLPSHTSNLVLAGNSVYVDKEFLRRYMPRLDARLSHRVVDVSSVVLLAQRWNPRVVRGAPGKASGHRALQDIRESIAELAYYKSVFFNT